MMFFTRLPRGQQASYEHRELIRITVINCSLEFGWKTRPFQGSLCPVNSAHLAVEVRGHLRPGSSSGTSELPGLVKIACPVEAASLARARAVCINGRWFVAVPDDLSPEYEREWGLLR